MHVSFAHIVTRAHMIRIAPINRPFRGLIGIGFWLLAIVLEMCQSLFVKLLC